jgi:pectate lyase
MTVSGLPPTVFNPPYVESGSIPGPSRPWRHGRRLRLALAMLGAALVLPLAAQAQGRDLGREILPANDGWASTPTAALPHGTIGGSQAEAGRDVVVTTRDELVAALAFPDATPKIVRIAGTLDANVDAANNPLSCGDYARPDPETGTLYSLPAYLEAYDPATWGVVEPNGPLERARVASAAAQQARVRIRIPANTTIVGEGYDARVLGAWFDVRPSSTSGNTPMNVIIRNLRFEDTFDCFPQWDPTDGAQGNWNALYDSISVRNATHVWVDHNAFRDVATADSTLPTYFGRLFQVHDGFLDVTNISDYVTISWNTFTDHDKTMLIGSSDSAVADSDALRVTLHHNLFEDLGQRVPRVRYGEVHVYNNLYRTSHSAADRFGYAWGVGIESAIHAEANSFFARAVDPAEFISRFNGSTLYSARNELNGRAFDPVAAYNAASGDTLENAATWTPVRFRKIHAPRIAHKAVIIGAGPYRRGL